MADSDPDHVLVPTLGRPREDEALAYALETFPDADVTLLAVVTPLDAPLSEGGVLERDDDQMEGARERAMERLESVVGDDDRDRDREQDQDHDQDRDRDRDRVRIEVAQGKPGTVVPTYASDEDVDHVVMYGHGTGTSGFVRRFLGRGIASTVVERTSEPVTVLE